MTLSPPALALHYLGGCPGRTRAGDVDVAVFDDRFEVRARGWGWRIAFASVVRVGGPQPTPDGDGQVVPVVWSPAAGDERTLMLSGRDAGRLRFLLAQGVAAERAAAERAAEERRGRPEAEARPAVRPPPSAWRRELHRMRIVTLAAMAVAVLALVVVFGVALLIVGRGSPQDHWSDDRLIITRRENDLRAARDRADAVAIAEASRALIDECQRLESFNGEAINRGADFAAVQQACAAAGVVLF